MGIGSRTGSFPTSYTSCSTCMSSQVWVLISRITFFAAVSESWEKPWQKEGSRCPSSVTPVTESST